MFRVGDTVLNEDFIAAIQPTNDDGMIVPANEATMIFVSLSSGGQAVIRAPMEDVISELERVGSLAPAQSIRTRAFSISDLEELKLRYEQGFRFAARDDDGKAFAFTARPTKGKACWINDDDASTVQRLYSDFDALAFDDDNPLEISTILDRLGVEA